MRHLFIIFLIFSSFQLFGDYSKESILLKQADRLTYSRNYDRANNIYNEILKLNPSNYEALKGYFNNLLRSNKTSEAKQLLDKYQKNVEKDKFTKLDVSFLLAIGKLKDARKEAIAFLKNSKITINNYKDYSRLFQTYRQYDTAIEILLLARNSTGDKELFGFELANLYKNNSDNERAISEYFAYLKKNKGYLGIVKKYVTEMVVNDKSVLKVLSKYSSDNIFAKEIYAFVLLENNETEKAIAIIKELPPDRILIFINDEKTLQNYENALDLVTIYKSKLKKAPKIADANLEMAKLNIKLGRIQKAKDILWGIYSDEKIQSAMFKFKTRANIESRKLLAEISLMERDDEKKAIKYLKEAGKFAYNTKEKKEISLKLIYLSTMKSNYDEAQKALSMLLHKENSQTDIFKQSNFYAYLIEAMQQGKNADSLLVNCIVDMPDSDLTSQALKFAYYISLLDKKSKPFFISAYQNSKLYRFDEAHSFLKKCYEISKKDEILLLSVDWYISEGNIDNAKKILNQKVKNVVVERYFELTNLNFVLDKTLYRTKAVDFLKQYPNSIFSPKIRMELKKYESE